MSVSLLHGVGTAALSPPSPVQPARLRPAARPPDEQWRGPDTEEEAGLAAPADEAALLEADAASEGADSRARLAAALLRRRRLPGAPRRAGEAELEQILDSDIEVKFEMLARALNSGRATPVTLVRRARRFFADESDALLALQALERQVCDDEGAPLDAGPDSGERGRAGAQFDSEAMASGAGQAAPADAERRSLVRAAIEALSDACPDEAARVRLRAGVNVSSTARRMAAHGPAPALPASTLREIYRDHLLSGSSALILLSDLVTQPSVRHVAWIVQFLLAALNADLHAHDPCSVQVEAFTPLLSRLRRLRSLSDAAAGFVSFVHHGEASLGAAARFSDSELLGLVTRGLGAPGSIAQCLATLLATRLAQMTVSEQAAVTQRIALGFERLPYDLYESVEGRQMLIDGLRARLDELHALERKPERRTC